MDKKFLLASIAIAAILFGAFVLPFAGGQNSYLYTYSVMSGDTLSSIGLKFNVSWSSIASLNGIPSPYTIYVGEALLIPLSSSFVDYTVQSGDSLYGISQQYETSWKTIAQTNGIAYPYTIHVGEILEIPLDAVPTSISSTTSQTSTTFSYTVQSGDSLYSIGQNFGVAWQTLAQMNGISSPYTIYVGQVLLIPSTTSTQTSTTSSISSKSDLIGTGNALYDQYDATLLAAASKYGLDPLIIKSQIAQESLFNSLATSSDDPCGQLLQNGVDVGHSYGLMQMTPACITWFARTPSGAVDLVTDPSSTVWNSSAFNPTYNIYSGAYALYSSIQYVEQHFTGCTSSQYELMALSTYNSGSGSVYGCSSYSSKGTTYINSILSWYQTFSSLSGLPDPY